MEVGGVGVRISRFYGRSFGEGGGHDKSIGGGSRIESGVGWWAPRILHLEGEAGCSILTIAPKTKWWRSSERWYRTLTSAHLIRADAELALIFLTTPYGTYNTTSAPSGR